MSDLKKQTAPSRLMPFYLTDRPQKIDRNAMPGFRLLLVISLSFLLAACSSAREVAPTAVPAALGAQAAQPDFPSVLAEGKVEPLRFVTLSFQTGGVVAAVLVEEGDRVEAGAPLVRLEAVDHEIARDQAQARVNSADSGLAGARARLDVARAQVRSATEQVTAAEARLDLVKAGARPEEIEAAEKSLAAAEAGVAQAIGLRDSALDIDTNAAVAAAQAQVASANAQAITLQDAYQTILDTCFDTPAGEVCPLYGPIEEQTRAQLAAAQSAAAAAQAQLDQLLTGPTAGQRSAAQGGVTLALAQRDIARANLALVQSPATAEMITQAEVAVRQAEIGVTIAEAGVTQAEAAVQQAEAALQTAQAALSTAEVALERTILTAPFAGTIGRVSTNEGQLMGPGVPVVILADFSGWLVKTTDLTELDVARIEPGSTVSVSFDAIPNEQLTGTVTDVALVAALSQGDIVYEVTVRLDETGRLPVRWGMTTFIEVDTR